MSKNLGVTVPVVVHANRSVEVAVPWTLGEDVSIP